MTRLAQVPDGGSKLPSADRPQAQAPLEAQTSTRLANGKIRLQATSQAAPAPRSNCLAN
ncbi:MAG: hypothetical protein HC860_15810 [Alkalinema sp. RU_4_3]|nr:hypothetical protein [Alkalinema sp. RU_4_3]